MSGDGQDQAQRILVIEDDPDVITLMETILADEGYRTIVARDGLEGLLKLRSGAVELALLDIMMPDVDGVRVLDQLLEEGGGELTFPVIVVTGSPEGAARSREVLGRANVFEKPFDPTRLLARIADLLTTEQA